MATATTEKSSAVNAPVDDRIHPIPIDEIFSDDEFNCRGKIAPIDVVDLSRSIQIHGLQQPIILQKWDKVPGKKYRIISGHRRFLATKIAKMPTIRAIINLNLDDLKARVLNLEENLKRQDLNILQEAKALQHFYDANWTEQAVMSELNVSRGWIQARYALLKLPPDIQMEAAAGFLTQEHIKQLATMKSRDQQYEAVRKIKDQKLAGDKGRIKIKEPQPRNAFAKKPRNRAEMQKMIEEIMIACGKANFATRCLAWAAGEINDFDVYRDLRDYAKETYNRDYALPNDLIQRAKLT